MYKILTFILFFMFFQRYALALEAKGFRAHQEGNLLHIYSPYGTKLYFGDVSFSSLNSYRLEIPLIDLKPQAFNSDGGSAGNSRNDSQSSAKEMPQNDSLILKANELYNKGKFLEAFSYVEELLRRDHKNVRGWIMKGSLLHVTGQKDLAILAWKEAANIDPDNQEIKKILTENSTTLVTQSILKPTTPAATDDLELELENQTNGSKKNE